MEKMSSKERWMAAIQCQPVDRLPFWPKIGSAYLRHQMEPFKKMNNAEFHRWIGSDNHLSVPSCVNTIRKKTKIEEKENGNVRTTVFHAPLGSLTSVAYCDAASRSWHQTEFPVKKPEDIEIMAMMFADIEVDFDPAQFEQASALIRATGNSGVVVADLGISPLMDWIQLIAGVENGTLLLVDHPEKVEELFRQMHRVLCRRAEVMAEKSPCQIIYSTENTSTTLISPDMFRKYCCKHLTDYGKIIKSKGKFHVLHMCGHLKALLDDIATLPTSALEAFTSPPLGNTTLLDGRKALFDKCLIGGTNAVLWLKDEREIIKTIENDLNMMPHHRGIVLTSAGVMPQGCNPEKIKKVAEWVKNYPSHF